MAALSRNGSHQPTKGEDLEYARQLINCAEQGILFLFFNPGAFEPADKPEQWTLLQNILARHQQGAPNYDGALYIHGVVNQEIAGLTTEGTAKPSRHAALDPTIASPVKLYGSGDAPPIPVTYELMVPKQIKGAFRNWQTEVMNQGVHVHSKVIVIDPFGKKPVVITGSHNLGYKASTKNDDNMMIVQGNAPLAAAYAANIIAIYQAYRWNTYVDAHERNPQVWHGLVDNADWQAGYLQTGSNDLAEIKFWLGEGASAPAAAGQPQPAPASGGTQARVATATGPSPHASNRRRSGSPAKKSPAKKGRSQSRRASAAKKTPSTKRAPAKSRRAAAKKAPVKTRRSPAKNSPVQTRRAAAKKAPMKTRRTLARKAPVKTRRAPSRSTKAQGSGRRRGSKGSGSDEGAPSSDPSASRIPVGGLRLRAVDDHELIGEHAVGGALVAIRPLHADFSSLGGAKADMDEARMAGGVAAAHVDETRLAARSRPDRYPRSDALRLGLGSMRRISLQLPIGSGGPSPFLAPRLR